VRRLWEIVVRSRRLRWPRRIALALAAPLVLAALAWHIAIRVGDFRASCWQRNRRAR